jgi:hypothetical protein
VKAGGRQLTFGFCRSCCIGQGASRSSAFHCAKEGGPIVATSPEPDL